MSYDGKTIAAVLRSASWTIIKPGESPSEANQRLMDGGPDVHEGEPKSDEVMAALRKPGEAA